MLKSHSLLLPCAALALCAGCAAVSAARQAQRDLAPRGEGAPLVRELPDLRGRSLAELVDFARENSPAVAAARLRVEDARLSLRSLAADAPLVSSSPWTSPSLAADVGHAESSRSSSLGDLELNTEGNASGGLSLDLLLYDFGRYEARARAASEEVLAAELSLLETGYGVFENVSAAYFTALEKDALLKVAETNEFVCAEHLREAEDRLDVGEGRSLDLLRARLDLAEAHEQTVAASNDVVVAGAELTCALGLDASDGTREQLLGVREEALEKALAAFAETDAPADVLYGLARTNAPAAQIARARLRAASADVDAAVAELAPTLSASVSLNWTDPLWAWRWGVSAAESLFTGGRKVAAVERARVALESAAAELDLSEQELSREISLAVAARDNAAKARATAAESLRQARENLETVECEFAVGEASRLDYTDAVAGFIRALGSQVTAFYSGQRAEAKLFRLVGRLPVYDERIVEAERGE